MGDRGGILGDNQGRRVLLQSKNEKEKMTGRFRFIFFLMFLTVTCFGLSACAGTAPGGTETVNRTNFSSPQDMKEKLDLLVPGMPEQQVYDTLGCKKEQLVQLDRNGIRRALFGGDTDLPGTPEQQMEIHTFLQQSYGYKLEYKDVKRKHGFSSPIRIQTDEKGYAYTITMVFHSGKLLEKPVLAGGPLNDTKSQTLFDFLNPGTALNFVR